MNGGAFNELDFLTHIPILNNDDNRDSIFNWVRGEVSVDEKGNIDESNRKSDNQTTVIFKKTEVKDTESLKRYYKENVYKYSGDKQSDLNPYLKLIRDFEDKTFNAMRFQAADFAYLTNLGVYPLNRMWTLRRYVDSAVVPNNLQKWGPGKTPYPMSTVVGWIDPEDKEFFNVSFNEEWVKITERLDEVLTKILQDEFKFNASKVISLPGWSQGLLFGFLAEMGLTDYNSTNIPQGDPAVLQEAAARAKDNKPGYGNKSAMNLTLTTSYEQKFIGTIDPGNAMLDIIHRCIYMGTRDTKFVLSGGGDNTILKSLRNAANNNTVENWWNFIKLVVNSFIAAIGKIFDNLTSAGDPDAKIPAESPAPKKDPKAEEETTSTKGKNKVTGALTKFLDASDGIAQTILASTVAKWRYALMGSISLMDGSNSTPWHLTLGNPYSPFVSLGNIVVKTVDFKFSNELGFNDMPLKLDVSIQVELGRNLGAQELFQMFNNGYKRVYSSASSSEAQAAKATELNSLSEAAANAGGAAGVNSVPKTNTKG